MRVKDVVGRHGEKLAARFLVQAGFEILDLNWRSTSGELDIVARDGPVTVFVEVKTRRGLDFGSPADAVTPAKQRRIRTLASQWLSGHRQPFGDLRFDVVSIVLPTSGPAAIEHLRGAF